MVSSALLEQISIGVTQIDLSGRYLQANSHFCQFIGYTEQELLQLRFEDLIHPKDRASISEHQQRLTSGQIESFALEKRLVTKAGQVHWVSLTLSLIRPESGEPNALLVIVQDITARKQVEIADQRQDQQRRLLYQISQQIRSSLDLNQILETTVDQIRSVLGIDRAVLYRFQPDWSGDVIAESVATGWPVMLGRKLYDPCLMEETCITPYTRGRIQRTADIHEAGLAECYVQLLDQFQVKANLVVPILERESLWGLIVAQHCQSPRIWTDEEVDLIRHLSGSISIAIQQAQLYQDLEQQVEERTQQLQQTLRYEALLRRIIEQVRQSLGEDEILSTAVQELGEELSTIGCNTTLFDDQICSGRVTHDYVRSGVSLIHHSFLTSSYPELFQQIISGWIVQLCHLDPALPRSGQTCLICPIADDQGVIGGLWLNRSAEQTFSPVEIALVQQVALQCAIGLRQARLYWSAQRQVTELEQLHLLKDDFLSTVSHELRTPLANIRMALYMLNLTPSPEKRQRYYEMAVSECARQTQLIEDLLSLQQLEAGHYESQIQRLDLQALISDLVDELTPQLQAKDQTIQLDLIQTSPVLNTDRSALERTLRELLDNAHKYSTAGAEIHFGMVEIKEDIQFQISNQGGLPTRELPRLFDKFYRVPSSDRWRHRGTGLGLALVQHLVGILQGQLWVTQDQGWIHFFCRIPKSLEARDPDQ